MKITKHYRVTIDWMVFRGKRYYKGDLVPVPEGRFKSADEKERLLAGAKEIGKVSARVVSDVVPQRVDDDNDKKKGQSKVKPHGKKAAPKEEDMNDE